MYVRTTLASLHDPARVTAAQFITAEHWRLHQTSPAKVWAATQPMSDLIRVEIQAGSSDGTLSPRNPVGHVWLMIKTIIGAYHHYASRPDDPAMATLGDDVWFFCSRRLGVDPLADAAPADQTLRYDGRSPLSLHPRRVAPRADRGRTRPLAARRPARRSSERVLLGTQPRGARMGSSHG